LSRALPVKDDNGKIIQWIGTCTDIDDQKMIQDKLRESLFKLKHSSEERTKLMAAERSALEASRIKSEFLANMTHEIRTPLNGVIAMAGFLKGTKLSTVQKDYAETIIQSADALLAIVNDILDLSKIEAGKLELESVNFNLEELLRSVIRVLGPTIKGKRVKILLSLSKDCPTYVSGDPSRLRQVVFNLLQNAVKFTESGQVELFVVTQRKAGAAELRFEVKDTGVGIEHEALDRIWDSFAQADASTTRKFGGTGLGLAICKRLVHLMGGRLGVESVHHVGSTFWFEVPILEVKRSLRLVRKSMPSRKPNKLNRSRVRILVAEDHSINQKVIRKMIETFGYYVDIVANGKEVLSALDQVPYDLIVMDCHMPEMDGYTASKKIRSHPNLEINTIPIVALTADVLRGTRQKCIAEGMNDYISKPIDIAKLEISIERNLKVKDLPEKPITKKSRQKKDRTQKSESVVDLKMLKKLDSLSEDGQSDLVAELVIDFMKDTPSRIREIGNSAKLLKRQELAEFSHALKSASASLGVKFVASTCSKLESLAAKADQEKLINLVETLYFQFRTAQAELKRLLADRESYRAAA
jgi:signal transduction histidine kinase/CheY-like chemotaxis protein